MMMQSSCDANMISGSGHVTQGRWGVFQLGDSQGHSTQLSGVHRAGSGVVGAKQCGSRRRSYEVGMIMCRPQSA